MTITEEATSNVYVRPVTSKDHKYTAFIVDNVINAAYKSSESWTNTNDLVWTDRITLEAANKLIQDHGKPDILLYAIERESKSSPSSCGKEDVAEEETVIGTLIIVLNEQKEGEALLSMLAVSPKQQSRGVGKLLMTEALKYIRMHLQ
ncbi:hypothetical protein BDF20DRAFT_864504, partial [Mycotypha africana]|uniref:uncharacterized protein n=1 Tax=Mycotypha africana TaxID=64632 RepID=UPI0023012C01